MKSSGATGILRAFVGSYWIWETFPLMETHMIMKTGMKCRLGMYGGL